MSRCYFYTILKLNLKPSNFLSIHVLIRLRQSLVIDIKKSLIYCRNVQPLKMLNKRSKQHSLLHFLIGKLDQTGFPHPFALTYNETYNESYISKLHHHEKMTYFLKPITALGIF